MKKKSNDGTATNSSDVGVCSCNMKTESEMIQFLKKKNNEIAHLLAVEQQKLKQTDTISKIEDVFDKDDKILNCNCFLRTSNKMIQYLNKQHKRLLDYLLSEKSKRCNEDQCEKQSQEKSLQNELKSKLCDEEIFKKSVETQNESCKTAESDISVITLDDESDDGNKNNHQTIIDIRYLRFSLELNPYIKLLVIKRKLL